MTRMARRTRGRHGEGTTRSTSPLTGTGVLLKTSLRYDAHTFAPWILIATVLSVSSVVLYPVIFPEQADRAAFAAAVGSNPALGLVLGPAFDLATVDGFNAWRSLALGGFLTALAATFTVVRATRGQEDSGQAELLASSVLGRGSRLLTGVGLALIESVLIGLVSGVATGLFGGDWESSLLLGATFTATGWMFTGFAAVASQLGTDARAASTLALGTLGVLYVLRGLAYSLNADAWAMWVNPLGWLTEARPATGNNWLPLVYAVVLTIICLTLAFVLQSKRDFGQGAVAPRPGPARGRIRSPWGLAIHINAGLLLTWIVAFILLGITFGYFTGSIEEVLNQDSAVAHILAAGAVTHDELIGAFFLSILAILGSLAAIPGVQVILKVRSEELAERVEPILAGAVSRWRYYAGNVGLAFLSSTIYLVTAGMILTSLAVRADVGISFADGMLQTLATVPAMWTVVAFSVLVVGVRPRVPLAAWAGVLMSFMLTLLGPSFNLPDWALGISPFWHVPVVTQPSPDWSGLLWVSLFTVGFLTVGFVGFRRRDLATT